MKKKTIAAVLATTMLAFTLAACGNDADTQTTGSVNEAMESVQTESSEPEESIVDETEETTEVEETSTVEEEISSSEDFYLIEDEAGEQEENSIYKMTVNGRDFNLEINEMMEVLESWTYDDCTEEDGIEALVKAFENNFDSADTYTNDEGITTEYIWHIGPNSRILIRLTSGWDFDYNWGLIVHMIDN